MQQVGGALLAALMDPSSDYRGRLSRTYKFMKPGTKPQPPKRHYRRRRGQQQQGQQQQQQQQPGGQEDQQEGQPEQAGP